MYFLERLSHHSVLVMTAKKLNPYSAGIDVSRQNLTSVDVRFWRLMSIPALRVKLFIMAVDP